MTSTAWIFMLSVWAIIIFFTGKFFLKVLTTPHLPESHEHGDPVVPFKDA
ncbi:MAG: hypothetical protein JNK60_00470 [Acidobacteria bacterium]|nr:hypothetical protein [Acidobacteriota bacterium]